MSTLSSESELAGLKAVAVFLGFVLHTDWIATTWAGNASNSNRLTHLEPEKHERKEKKNLLLLLMLKNLFFRYERTDFLQHFLIATKRKIDARKMLAVSLCTQIDAALNQQIENTRSPDPIRTFEREQKEGETKTKTAETYHASIAVVVLLASTE